MSISLSEAVKIAHTQLRMRGERLGNHCTAHKNGWSFSHVDKKGWIFPDDTSFFVDVNGVFSEVRADFDSLRNVEQEERPEINISKLIKKLDK